MEEKVGNIYMLTNKTNEVIYTGVTNDLKRRIYEHRNKMIKGFTERYQVQKLVYFELFNRIDDAIVREKRIKGGSRAKKIKLISSLHPQWGDLYDKI